MKSLSRCLTASQVGLAASACWVLAAAGPSPRTSTPSPPAQLNPPGRLACGAYEAVTTGAVGLRPTRLLLQREGRVMTIVTDYAIAGVSCDDLTGDGQPELLARTLTGGAHCCETVRAWSLRDKPRLILDYAAGNAGGASVRDLNGDGRAELLLGDDGLAYFDDLDYASSPSSLPLVACFTGESFRDCTTENPAPLREAAGRFREQLEPSVSGALPKRVRGAALGLFAVSLLLGEEDQARQTIQDGAQNEKLMAWLGRVTPRLRVWAEARGRKLKRPE
jgi:hypothetical protein